MPVHFNQVCTYAHMSCAHGRTGAGNLDIFHQKFNFAMCFSVVTLLWPILFLLYPRQVRRATFRSVILTPSHLISGQMNIVGSSFIGMYLVLFGKLACMAGKIAGLWALSCYAQGLTSLWDLTSLRSY